MAEQSKVKVMVPMMVLKECPGCGQQVNLRAQIEMSVLDSKDPANVVMNGKVLGIELSHNCIPKATRTARSPGPITPRFDDEDDLDD